MQFRHRHGYSGQASEHELKYKNEGALSDDLQNKPVICSEIPADVDNKDGKHQA